MDYNEAAGIATKIKALMDAKGIAAKEVFETSEGEIKFSSATETWHSIFPVNNSYQSWKTNKRNEVLGIGLHSHETLAEVTDNVVKMIRRMRRANKMRADYAAICEGLKV